MPFLWQQHSHSVTGGRVTSKLICQSLYQNVSLFGKSVVADIISKIEMESYWSTVGGKFK